LISGDVDANSSIEYKTFQRLAQNPNLNVLNLPSGSAITCPMHVTTAPYDDNNVRMAMKLVMDRDELNDKIFFGAATVGNDFHVSPNMPYYPEGLEQRVYDPDKAKWHLKQAGHDSLSMNMSASDSIQPGAVDFVTLYAEQAKAAGINITPVREPGDGYWADVWLKKPFMFSSWGGRPTPDTIFTLAYQTGAAWSEAFWSNARFDELLLQAKAELDDTLRAEMYREMCMIARDDGGSIVPHFTNYVYAHNTSVGRPDLVSNTWELDGARAYQRWWMTS
jgi:peptide/nickel transport system substrate-binding protein